MNHSLLSIILLALVIVLTITATTIATPSNKVYAIENFLQLRSANVNHNGGDMDVDIQTGGSIPSKGKIGFGYAMLTDVGDEFVNNALVAITDIGIKNYDNQKMINHIHTYLI